MSQYFIRVEMERLEVTARQAVVVYHVSQSQRSFVVPLQVIY